MVWLTYCLEHFAHLHLQLQMQADFPSTPSSFYSKRIFESAELNKEGGAGELMGSSALSEPSAANNLALMNNSLNSTATTTSSIDANNNNNSNNTQLSIDQTTKSLEKLYVNPVSL